MLTHKGTKEIKTQRLLLRAIKPDDYNDMYNYVIKEEVAKYVLWTPHKSIDETKALCEMWANEYKSGSRYNWAIVYKNIVIGSIDVVKIVGESAFLGWQVDSTYWNKGIMTEAAQAVRDYLFNEIGIKEILASYITENIGSGRVMQKISMTPISLEKYQETLGKDCKAEIDGMPLSFYRLKKSDLEK